MTGHLLIFTLSVLLTGVFAADDVSLSVEEGESVTLHIKTDEIQGADDLFWFFNGSKNIIAKIDLEGNKSSVPGNKDVEQFRNKLKLDHQTGSLTISDVRSTNTGEYHLQISRRSGISDKRFNVTLNGVFAADDVSLSVEEGGSVTLHIKTDEIQGADDLLWFFNGSKTIIAEIDLEGNKSSVPGNKDVEQFRNKLKLDHQTGSLTISDVRSTNTGEYHLQISRRSGISNKRFNVTLNGVFAADDVSLSVEEGGSVTLHIKTDEIQGAHDLLWFFNGNKTFIAEIDLESNQSSVPGNKDVEQFRNKLKLDHQTGSLTISDVRSTNTGEYRLEISRRSGISNKRFNVTLNVKDQRSHWMITGPVLAVVLLLLLVMSVVIYMHYRKRAEML